MGSAVRAEVGGPGLGRASPALHRATSRTRVCPIGLRASSRFLALSFLHLIHRASSGSSRMAVLGLMRNARTGLPHLHVMARTPRPVRDSRWRPCRRYPSPLFREGLFRKSRPSRERSASIHSHDTYTASAFRQGSIESRPSPTSLSPRSPARGPGSPRRLAASASAAHRWRRPCDTPRCPPSGRAKTRAVSRLRATPPC